MKEKIAFIYRQLNETEKEIADFFLEHGSQAIHLGIKETAKQLHTSVATISRFVKKYFNCSFADFKLQLAASLSEEKPETVEFGWNISYDLVPQALQHRFDTLIKNLWSFNKLSDIDIVGRHILEAGTVFLLGVGSSGLVAQDLMQKLIKFKRKAVYIQDSNFAVLSSMLTTKDDIAIAFSDSGSTREILVPLKRMKKNGTYIVSITGTQNSPMTKLSDISFFVPSNEMTMFRLGSVFARYGQLFVVDCLFVKLAQLISDKPEELIKEYRELLYQLR